MKRLVEVGSVVYPRRLLPRDDGCEELTRPLAKALLLVFDAAK